MSHEARVTRRIAKKTVMPDRIATELVGESSCIDCQAQAGRQPANPGSSGTLGYLEPSILVVLS
jgi:hypothetical protein